MKGDGWSESWGGGDADRAGGGGSFVARERRGEMERSGSAGGESERE